MKLLIITCLLFASALAQTVAESQVGGTVTTSNVWVNHLNDVPGTYTCEEVPNDDACLTDMECVLEPLCDAVDGKKMPGLPADFNWMNSINDNPGMYTCHIAHDSDPCFSNGDCVLEPQCPAKDGKPISVHWVAEEQIGSDETLGSIFYTGGSDAFDAALNVFAVIGAFSILWFVYDMAFNKNTSEFQLVIEDTEGTA